MMMPCTGRIDRLNLMEANNHKRMRTESKMLMNDLKAVARDAEELLNATGATVAGKADAAREQLRHTVERAKITCADLQAIAEKQVTAAESAIRTRPLRSVGLAVGFGVLLGLILGRRS